ncbi:hypothetical protein KUTeg_003269, partial [Tegillarca granosa]
MKLYCVFSEQRYAVDMSVYASIEDLTLLVGPLTEESVVRCLQSRFYSQAFQTRIGPVVVTLNSNRHRPSPTLVQCSRMLLKKQYPSILIQETHRPSFGESGGGKTFCAMQLLRQLFDIVGGGPGTDAFKHLSATLTVLQSLCSATTISNLESSRGMFVENFITDAAIYRTKIHAFPLDRMLAGLSIEEKAKLHLTGYSVHNLRYLSSGITSQNEAEDKSRFDAWKNCLSVLGIPFSDVMRILSSVLLLGNVEFVEGTGLELDIRSRQLLHYWEYQVLPYIEALRQEQETPGDRCANHLQMANVTRDSLAKALYCRTMTAILKRANSLRRPTSNSLSDSTESNLHQVSNVSLSSKNSAFNRLGSSRSFDKSTKVDGFISIVDMFGFEISEVNRLEQLCINLCAETMQHYYNTHIFKSTSQALQEEDIRVETEVAYFDNEPILELLSSQRSGIFHILDTECTQPRTFFEPLTKSKTVFGVRHFAGRVLYDATNFLPSNRDILPDDIISIFSKQNCNFGFASHLFAQEIKHTSDNLLKTLVHSKPQFVHCIKTNDHGEMDLFDKDVVIRQLRSLQLLETVRLMAGGIPHRMRYRAFNNRYGIFLAKKNPYLIESQQNYCKEILNSFLRAMDESKLPYVSTQWTIGKKHLFFSELTRQHLEAMRTEKINNAVAKIQAYWRGWKCRKEWPSRKKQLLAEKDFLKSVQPKQRRNVKTPEIPFSRTYSVIDKVRLGYPQVRIMKGDYPIEPKNGQALYRGDEVGVVGPSQNRGHLIVEKGDVCLDVPYSLLGFK